MYKTRKIKKRHIVEIIIILLFVLIIAFVFACQGNIKNMLLRASEATVRSITTTAINDAILVSLDDGLKYEDVISIDRNANGDIVSMRANSIKVNKITRDTAYVSMKYLDECMAQGVDLPIGSFTGLEILSGFGPKVNFKLVSVSNVECKFISKFFSVGINQTKHSLYLHIIADISIIMPNDTTNFSSVNEVFICENIIIGKVPETYLQTEEWSNATDLIPQK